MAAGGDIFTKWSSGIVPNWVLYIYGLHAAQFGGSRVAATPKCLSWSRTFKTLISVSIITGGDGIFGMGSLRATLLVGDGSA